MSDKVKKTRTLPVEVEYIQYTNLNDILDIANWIGRVENIESAMSQPGAPVTFTYLVPGPFGTTNEVSMKLGDYIIKDLDGKVRVYNDRGFRQYFEV